MNFYCNFEGDYSGNISQCQECTNYVLDYRDIKDSPTVYDVDKVVKELTKHSYMETVDDMDPFGDIPHNVISLEKAIAIVKTGGIEK